MKNLESMDDGGDIFDDEPRRGVLPSHLRRVPEVAEEDEASSGTLGRSTSRRSKESNHSLWHRRGTQRERGLSNATMHGGAGSLGFRPPGSPSSVVTGSGVGGPSIGGFWGRRSHDTHDAERGEGNMVLPVTEPGRGIGSSHSGETGKKGV